MWAVYRRFSLNKTNECTTPLFDDIKNEICMENSEECARQIQAIHRTPSEDNSSTPSVRYYKQKKKPIDRLHCIKRNGEFFLQEWQVVKELSIGCCNGQDKPRRVLRALKAALTNERLVHTICGLISPELRTDLIFSTEGGLGVSLRAFLCLSIVNRARESKEVNDDLLQRIHQLSKDLLDNKAFEYHRSKLKLAMLHSKLANKNKVNGHSAEDRRDKVEVEDSLDEKRKLLDERNELVILLSRMEAERVVVPNPVSGFFALQTFYNQYPDNQLAQEFLQEITSHFLPLIK